MEELTLEQLSKRTGVEPRTLRSWVAEGLLSPPFKPGRGATYPASNADRALAIRALKDLHGLTLPEIGRRFLMASDEQIREWASEAGQASAPAGSARQYLQKLRDRVAATETGLSPSPARSTIPVPPAERLEQRYSRTEDIEEAWRQLGYPAERLEQRYSRTGSYTKPTGFPPELDVADRTRIEKLIFALEALLTAPAPRRASSTVWTRISITADLELSVRGHLEPAERHLFEQLANQLRAILTGRTKA